MAMMPVFPQASPAVEWSCLALYMLLAIGSAVRLCVLLPRHTQASRTFHYLLIGFCLCRMMALVVYRSSRYQDLCNRLALCAFFTVVVYQVWFWMDVVYGYNRISATSKRLRVTFIILNILFYCLVLFVEIIPSSDSSLRPSTDDSLPPVYAVRYDIVPDLCMAIGSIVASIGLLHASYRMKTRVLRAFGGQSNQLLDGKADPQEILQHLYYFRVVMSVSAILFALRSILYLQVPFSHRECGNIRNPDVCIVVGFVIPEIVPCTLLFALMWTVDHGLEDNFVAHRSPVQLNERTPLFWETSSAFAAGVATTPSTSPAHPSNAPTAFSRSIVKTPRNIVHTEEPRKSEPRRSFYWVSLRIADRKNATGASQIVIRRRVGDAEEELGRTEIVDEINPQFNVMLPFWVAEDASDSFVVLVYSIRDVANSSDLALQTLISTLEFDTRVLLMKADPQVPDRDTVIPGVVNSLTLKNIDDSPDEPGRLVLRVECVGIPSTSHSYGSEYGALGRITRSFKVALDEGQSLLLEEDLVESPYTWVVPYQMIQMVYADAKRNTDLLGSKLDRVESQNGDTEANSKFRPRAASGNAFGGVLHQIREDFQERKLKKWRMNLLKKSREYIAEVETCLEAYEAPISEVTFKPSTKKADGALRFVALNLHQQIFIVGRAIPDDINCPRELNASESPFREYSLYGITTVGAFAAHVYGFKSGGIRQMKEVISSLETQAQELRHTKRRGPEYEGSVQSLEQQIGEISWELDRRMEVAFSQAVATLVTSFQQTLYVQLYQSTITEGFGGKQYLEQLFHVGFLFSVESLLSTYGREAGMLGDMDAAVSHLQNVRIQLRPVRSSAEAADKLSISRVAYGMIIDIPVIIGMPSSNSEHTHRIIGQDLRSGAVYIDPKFDFDYEKKLIKVFPVLFTQGLNEMQTVANTVGRSDLQKQINGENLEKLKNYFDNYSAFGKSSQDYDASEEHLVALMETIHEQIFEAKKAYGKNMSVLELTSQLVRRIGGGRVTCCKSAKDRTAMSTTLEESSLLVRSHGVPPEKQSMLTDCFRAYGVRRENARKNIGVAQYCFSSLQNYLLPPAYQCPPGTGGGSRAQS